MKKLSFENYINGVGNDLKISIDDIINIILKIQEDVTDIKKQIKNETKSNIS